MSVGFGERRRARPCREEKKKELGTEIFGERTECGTSLVVPCDKKNDTFVRLFEDGDAKPLTVKEDTKSWQFAHAIVPKPRINLLSELADGAGPS
ncbi:hypothetical protein HPB50_013088 [Hyalomma asiaticum]|uniref:Uncharacterized protein n=1 Tax=Hyalomma asiaticum TaxID=266040 RepID=A0ACB7RXB1_HYAAI|nr:hypothetical protein HPB50_013088 [Hyalomma asiaticum]